MLSTPFKEQITDEPRPAFLVSKANLEKAGRTLPSTQNRKDPLGSFSVLVCIV